MAPDITTSFMPVTHQCTCLADLNVPRNILNQCRKKHMYKEH